MPTIEQVLEEYTTRALTAAAGVPAPALVHPTTNPQFGDYQANGVMAVAKARKLNPRELAQKVTAQLDPAVVPATWEIAGPGFINFRLDDWGTQFGMLIVGYRTILDRAAYERDPLTELERVYKVIQAQAKADPAVAARVREELAKLQQGDPDNTALWQEFTTVSRAAF